MNRIAQIAKGLNRKTEWSRIRRESGLCTTCSNPVKTYKSLCDSCMSAQRNRMRARRNSISVHNAIVSSQLPHPDAVRYQTLCRITGTVSGCYLLALGELPSGFRSKIKITKGDTCWNWTGPRVTNPRYPQHQYGFHAEYLGRENGKTLRKGYAAHKFCYQSLVGAVPQGKELDHLCENKLCVNPAHLEPVTHQENVIRGFLRRSM